MPHYRAYRLTPAGKIKTGDWFEADDDVQARGVAHEFCDAETPTVELWQGSRFIARLPCEDANAA